MGKGKAGGFTHGPTALLFARSAADSGQRGEAAGAVAPLGSGRDAEFKV
jgi:hypothetical protein